MTGCRGRGISFLILLELYLAGRANGLLMDANLVVMVVLALAALVVFKRKYYWMHEEYLASPGKYGEDGSERCRIIEGPYPLANYFVYL